MAFSHRHLTGQSPCDGFERLRRGADSGDVFQNTALHLWRALDEVTPATPPDFFRLAALQIWRELVDRARRHYRPHGE